MARSIGLVEYRTVSSGITADDTMVKTADIEVLQASAVCPGKYVIIVAGELSAVKASVDAAKAKNPEQMVDSFVLGNPHEDIFRAIYGGGEIGDAKALGVLEALSAPSMIVAADTAAKASEVKLIELRIARGLGGRSYMLLTGTVASVSAAIERAKVVIGEEGMLLDYSVIPNPDKTIWQSIL
jgi:microcompartment protein CcmL/EutN